MNEKAEQIECKAVGCSLKGYWHETLPSGKRVVCFRAKHRGSWHVVKLELPENVKELKPH
jgi:hypothetical protein